jgi:heme A synthase
MNAFHVLGGLLALWALVVSFLGITRENFPATRGTERIVTAISIVLVILAIASAALTSAAEGEEEPEEEAAALVSRGG